MSTQGAIPEFGIARDNEERRDGGCAVVFDPETQRYAVGSQRDRGAFRLFSGGVDAGETMEQGVLREVVEESGLDDFAHVEEIAQAFTHYYNSLKKVNRVALATCFLVILKSRRLVPAKLEAHETFTLVWKTAHEIMESWKAGNQNKDYDHWMYFFRKSVARAKELGHDRTTGDI